MTSLCWPIAHTNSSGILMFIRAGIWETFVYIQGLLVYQRQLKQLLMESLQQVRLMVTMVQEICVLDHRYACPELLTILEEELNILAGNTREKTRKYFPVKHNCLNLLRSCERGTFKHIYNCCFRIVATRWKDSKTLQFISILRKLEKHKSSDREVNK